MSMRQFVVLGHHAPIDPDFSLDDLAGAAGRLDVICRCVNSALFLSHGIRDAVQIHLVVQDELTVRIDSADLRYMNPDERNIAGLLRQALEAKDQAIGHREAESTPGIHVSKRGFQPVLESIDGTVVELHEDGDPLADVDPPTDPVFVLSDHEDFTDEEAVVLAEHSDKRVRVSPEILHADHTITVAHNYLDTQGFSEY
jgi:tRNA (pseudouridine54-N1)-methyltransferase